MLVSLSVCKMCINHGGPRRKRGRVVFVFCAVVYVLRRLPRTFCSCSLDFPYFDVRSTSFYIFGLSVVRFLHMVCVRLYRAMVPLPLPLQRVRIYFFAVFYMEVHG